MKDQRPVLLVEDDLIDAMTVRRAFSELKVTNPLVVAGNGEEALEYLQSTGEDLPGIILLDLNMPKMNGIEFLAAVKASIRLRRIPVVVLTTSTNEQDKLATYQLSVAGYMVKPVDYAKFVETLKTIHQYWSLSELP